MKEIKLIVNYSVSNWTGSGYIDNERSKIFTFNDPSQISNTIIEKSLFELHENPINILNIQKI